MIPSTSSMDRPVAPVRGLGRRGRLLLATGVLLALGAALFAPAARRFLRAERSVDARTLRVGVVTVGDLKRDLSVQGKAVAALHPTLFSPAPGIVSLATRAGAVVRRGDLLVGIESPELRSRLSQESTTLLSLRSDLGRQRIAARQAGLRSQQTIALLEVRLEAARRSLERNQRSFAAGIIDRVRFEEAQDALQVTTLELDNARAGAGFEKETLAAEVHERELMVTRQESVVAELQRQVDQLGVRAPFDGMVATLTVKDRDAVAANQPLLTVVDLSAYEVEIAIPEEYARETAIGTAATIVHGGKQYPAKVTTVSPEVVGGEVEATVAFDGPTPAGIRQNERVGARLVFESRSNVLKLPRGPFLESGGGHKAYVVDGSLATLRDIRIGAVSVAEVEVTGGLAAGEQVVLSDTSPFGGAGTVLLRR